MKKFYLLLLAAFLAGCSNAGQGKPVVVKINNYEITADEFEQEFRTSPYSRKDTPESRRQFLETLINRKLILQEAQRLGLDKQEDFLKSIERFWEQSLLKAYLDREEQDVSGKVLITDDSVQEAYNKLQAEGKTDNKTYNEMYKQIKWELTRAKEAQLMDQHMKDLRNKANIQENLDIIKAK